MISIPPTDRGAASLLPDSCSLFESTTLFSAPGTLKRPAASRIARVTTGRESGLVGEAVLWQRSTSRDERYQEQNQEDDEQHLSHPRRRPRHAPESQDRSDQRDNQKHHCPVQHDSSPRFLSPASEPRPADRSAPGEAEAQGCKIPQARSVPKTAGVVSCDEAIECGDGARAGGPIREVTADRVIGDRSTAGRASGLEPCRLAPLNRYEGSFVGAGDETVRLRGAECLSMDPDKARLHISLQTDWSRSAVCQLSLWTCRSHHTVSSAAFAGESDVCGQPRRPRVPHYR